MKNLNWELKQLCERHVDGAYATREARGRTLAAFANALADMGYTKLTLGGIKPKHIEAFIAQGQESELTSGTLKNRLSHLRWMAEKIGKQNIVARTNDAYGIADRVYVTNTSKARELTNEQLSKVTDRYCAMSLQLQAAFGLRREESLKIQPDYADRGDHLTLKDSWCKGGKARDIPMTTDAQRQLINEAKALANGGSLIQKELSYKEQLRVFRSQCDAAGIHNVHGHRHGYAQERYATLTGWACPAQGGPVSKQLTTEQKRIDKAARLTISKELGHERESITAVYLGR
ncbi:MAG TPA: phage integrase N-terminal domain-containing protein [Burkholderiaceae bacterium]|jgi:site-specific recombinase XerC